MLAEDLKGNIALAIFEAGGALGAFTSGTVSDWLGRLQRLASLVGYDPLQSREF